MPSSRRYQLGINIDFGSWPIFARWRGLFESHVTAKSLRQDPFAPTITRIHAGKSAATMRARCVLASALLLVPHVLAQDQIKPWGQCGGVGWTGATVCTDGWTCSVLNYYWSQCIPATTTTSTSVVATSSESTSTTSAPEVTTTPTPTTTTVTSVTPSSSCVPSPPWAALKPRSTGPPIIALDGWAAGSYLQKSGTDAATLGPSSSRGWFVTALSIRLIYSCPSFLYFNIHEAATSYKPLAFEATGTTFTWTFSGSEQVIGTTDGANTFVACSNGDLFLQTGTDFPSGNCTTTRLRIAAP